MNHLDAAIGELSALAIFSGVSREAICELCCDGRIVVTSHREYLFKSGDPANFFGVVLSGAYKLSRPSLEGEDVIVHFSTPGDVVGAFIMAQPNPIYPVSAIAMGPSRFLRLPKSIYLTRWARNPDLIFRIQSLLSTRMSLLQDQKAMAKAPLAQKVAALLIVLLERQPNSNDLSLPLPLTRKEIADNLGASVESVIRIMSDWSKKGIITTSDHQIRVLKPEKVIECLSSEQSRG